VNRANPVASRTISSGCVSTDPAHSPCEASRRTGPGPLPGIGQHLLHCGAESVGFVRRRLLEQVDFALDRQVAVVGRPQDVAEHERRDSLTVRFMATLPQGGVQRVTDPRRGILPRCGPLGRARGRSRWANWCRPVEDTEPFSRSPQPLPAIQCVVARRVHYPGDNAARQSPDTLRKDPKS
jgi:hypothetical protein